MGGFLLELVGWLRELFPPFKIIRPDEQGSLLKVGRPGGTLQPGLHWYIPFFHEIRVYNVAYQQIDLPIQSVPTQDDKDVSFSANVGYRITDAQSMDLLVQDFDDTLKRAAAGWLATKLGTMPYDRVRDERTEIQRELKRSLGALVKDWGVVIEDVRFTDFVRARQIRLIQ